MSSPTGNKRLRLFIGIVMVLLGLWIVAGAIIRLTATQPTSTSAVSLPQENRMQELTSGYLYASNEQLSELLPNIDLSLKLQGLRSDRDSEMFEYPEWRESGEGQALQNCVEFKYFQRDELKVTLTLIPPDPSCFTDDEVLQQRIADLSAQYRYVYAVEATQR